MKLTSLLFAMVFMLTLLLGMYLFLPKDVPYLSFLLLIVFISMLFHKIVLQLSKSRNEMQKSDCFESNKGADIKWPYRLVALLVFLISSLSVVIFVLDPNPLLDTFKISSLSVMLLLIVILVLISGYCAFVARTPCWLKALEEKLAKLLNGI